MSDLLLNLGNVIVRVFQIYDPVEQAAHISLADDVIGEKRSLGRERGSGALSPDLHERLTDRSV
jgi:hypothetical protein